MQASPKIDLRKDLATKALKGALADSQVPMRYHLKVIAALHKAYADHAQDRQGFMELLNQITSHLKESSVTHESAQKLIQDNAKELARLQSITHLKGDQGEPGAFVKGTDGRDGKDAVAPSVEMIIQKILPLLPQPRDGKDAPNLDPKALVEEVLRELQKGDKLHIKDIRGAAAFMRDGIKYRFEELMHGGGTSSSSGTHVYSEAVSGSGTSWTLAHTPTSGSVALYANGKRLTVTTDYTIVGAAITTLSSWTAGTVLADYTY